MIKVIKTYKILLSLHFIYNTRLSNLFLNSYFQIFYFEIKHFLNSFQKNVHFLP